ncbi:hypothetical protein [Pantoea agglomerans]|uniref:hypothetical protein n=1 Tax=Enterobacter agglomerans TaxID=549 RepID=UPI00301980E1
MIKFKKILDIKLENEYLKCIKPLVSVNKALFEKDKIGVDFIEYVDKHIDKILISPYPTLLEIAHEIYEKFPIIQEAYARDTFFISEEKDINSLRDEILHCKLNSGVGKERFEEIKYKTLSFFVELAKNKKSHYLSGRIDSLLDKNIDSEMKQALIKLCDYTLSVSPYEEMQPWVSEIRNVFNYKKIKNEIILKIILELDINICPMCNSNKIEIIKDFETGKDYRPAMDHFLASSRHPIFSLSLYNLIPCCYTCNTTFKGSKETYYLKYNNPYVNGVGDNALFDFSQLVPELNYDSILEKRKGLISTIPGEDAMNNNVALYNIKGVYNQEAHLDEFWKLATAFKEYEVIKQFYSLQQFKEKFLGIVDDVDYNRVERGKFRGDAVNFLQLNISNRS